MKKLVTFILVLAATFAFAGCSSDGLKEKRLHFKFDNAAYLLIGNGKPENATKITDKDILQTYKSIYEADKHDEARAIPESVHEAADAVRPTEAELAKYGIAYDEASLTEMATYPFDKFLLYVLGADGAYAEAADEYIYRVLSKSRHGRKFCVGDFRQRSRMEL